MSMLMTEEEFLEKHRRLVKRGACGIGGTTCVICNRHVEVYDHYLNLSRMRVLVELALVDKEAPKHWVMLNKFLPHRGFPSTDYSGGAKMRLLLWRLMRAKPESENEQSAGLHQITEEGWDFVLGKSLCPNVVTTLLNIPIIGDWPVPERAPKVVMIDIFQAINNSMSDHQKRTVKLGYDRTFEDKAAHAKAEGEEDEDEEGWKARTIEKVRALRKNELLVELRDSVHATGQDFVPPKFTYAEGSVEIYSKVYKKKLKTQERNEKRAAAKAAKEEAKIAAKAARVAAKAAAKDAKADAKEELQDEMDRGVFGMTVEEWDAQDEPDET